jgi:hypothetical protein
METQSVKDLGDTETLEEYETRSFNCRKEVERILDLKSKGLIGQIRPLEVVMSEISREAQANGLTPEILEEILAERS